MLLLLVFGIIEFGIIYNTKITITNAAREGARKAAVTSDSGREAAVGTAITNSVSSLNDTVTKNEDAKNFSTAPTAADTIYWWVEGSGAGNPVKVYVKGRVDVIVPGINLITGPTMVIPAKAEMMIE